jgi:Starch-binding associating with outer membrane
MKKYISIIVVAILLVSCSKGYLDINDNPNTATQSSVATSYVLPRALHSTAARLGAGYRTFNRWCGQWSRGGDFGPNVPEENYQITNSFSDGTWNAIYDNANDYDFVEKKAKSLNQNFYQGIAKVMKTVNFSEAVDLFNNVPYTKAFDLAANIVPKYDKAEDIYKDFFIQLDNALVLINSAGADPDIVSADIMFNADKAKWRKFINTLRLKYIIRLSNTSGIVNPTTEFAKITSEGFIGPNESAAVNPGYKTAFSGSNVSQQSPFWENYKKGVNGNESDRSVRANAFTIASLSAFPADPRLPYFFSPAAIGGNFIGTIYGQNVILLNSDNQSNVGGPGLAKSSGQSQWLLTSVESMFLQAEAKQRYPSITSLPSGNAQVLFENAVRESFAFLGIPGSVGVANTYLASNKVHTIPPSLGGGTVNLTDFASSTNKIETIVHQKYFSLIGMAAFEIYVDYRRTGFPKVPRTAATSALATDSIPKRYLYPQIEFNVNQVNVNAQGTINAQTSKIFWAQ